MAVGNLAGAIPAGWLLQNAGLRKALMVCLVYAPAALCTRSLLPAFPLQLILAFLTGAVLSLWAICIPPAVAGTTNERQRPFAFSLLFSTGIGLGALGGLAGSRMPGWLTNVSQHVHLPAPDQLTLIASCCFATLGIIPAASLHLARPVIAARARPVLSPSLMRFLPAVLVWGLVTGSFSPLANVFFAVHLRLPLRQIGTVFSISQLCQVAAVLCAPLVLRRWGVIAGIISAQLATSLCFALLALSSRPALASGVYVALTAFQWMNEPALYTMLMSIVPEEQRGGASASMSLAVSFSQLVAAATAGWAFTTFGYPPVLGTIAFVAMIAAALFGTIPRVGAATALPCGADVHGG
jgi:MFS family permease